MRFLKVAIGDAEVLINIDSANNNTIVRSVPEDVILKIKENPELIDFIRKYNNKED